MSVLDFIDHLMNTTPRTAAPVPVTHSLDLHSAHVKVDQLQRDIDLLNADVSVAEARLRARSGGRLPPGKEPAA